MEEIFYHLSLRNESKVCFCLFEEEQLFVVICSHGQDVCFVVHKAIVCDSHSTTIKKAVGNACILQ